LNNDIGFRIGELIATLRIKKVRFAEKIHVEQSYVTQLTTGKRNPSDRLVDSICREFNVNETWLRTGEGDMFRPRTRNDLISDFVGDILNSEPDFRQQLIGVLARMTPEEWRILERKAVELTDGLSSQGGQAIASVAPQNQLPELTDKSAEPDNEDECDPEARAQAEEYYRELILEKRARTSRASTYGNAG